MVVVGQQKLLIKLQGFVDIAETFHLPVVHLVDNPGFVIGLDAEKSATDVVMAQEL